MDPNDEKPDLVDLITEAVSAPDDEAEVDVPEDTPEEAPAEEVGEEAPAEETPAEETPAEETKEDAPPKSEHEQAVDKELEDLGIKNEKSRERFRELANEARDLRPYKERFEEQEKVFRHMEDAGISGEQFGIMTAIASDVNSGDPLREERAYKALMAEATALAQKLGYEAPGVDPLKSHQDLAQEVEDGLITRERALELARGRAMNTRQSEFQTRRAERDTVTASINDAKGQLTDLENQLKAQDPDYARKRAIVEPLIKAQIASGSLHPSQWAPTFAAMYGNVQLPAVAKPAPIVKPAPDNRGRPSARAGAPAPKNAQEAIMASLGMAPE